MDVQVKDAILQNRTLLMRNIIPCKELLDKLAEFKVFPESTLAEIRECESAEGKVVTMLEYIAFRGGQVATRFCDALQLSGHNFVADFLREEITSGPSSQQNETAEIIRKFAKLDKALADKEREELTVYINDKVKEQALRQMWRGNAREKEKALDAKQRQLEEAWKFHEVLKSKEGAIQDLNEVINKINHESKNKEEAVRALNAHIESLKHQHKDQMHTQIQYNLANDKSLSRMNERHVEMQNLINEINTSLGDIVKRRKSRGSTASKDGSNMLHDSDIVNLTNSQGAVIRKHINDINRLLSDMDRIKAHLKELEDEQNYVLVQIHGAKYDSAKKNLLDSFRDFTVQKEETITALTSEIDRLKQALKAKDLNNTTTETISNLQNELEEIKSSLKQSEKKIGVLEQENMRLRALMTEMESSKHTPKETDRSTKVGEGLAATEKPLRAVFLTQRPQNGEPPQGHWAIKSVSSDTSNNQEARPQEKPTQAEAEVTKVNYRRQSSPHPHAHSLIQPVRAAPDFRLKVDQKPIHQAHIRSNSTESPSPQHGVTLPPLNPSKTDVVTQPSPRRIPNLTGKADKAPPGFLDPPKVPFGLKAQNSFAFTSSRKQKPPLLRQDSKARLHATRTLTVQQPYDSVVPLKRLGTFYNK